MKLSAVIPVYNAEKYLPKLFECFANQTFHDFELSIVNDGSTDNSEELILDFINKNPDIKVIYSKIPNSGQGAARELGIKASSSEYICFIDSDDYIENDYFESFNKIIEEYHPDMVCSNYFINDNEKVDNVNFDNVLLNEEQIKKIIYPYLIQTNRYTYFPPTLWAKAFRKDLYVQNICKKNIKVGEDIAVFIPTFLSCKTVYLSNKHLYHYRINDSSVMQVKKPRNYDDVIYLYYHLKEKMSESQFNEFSMQINRLIAHVAFNCSITQFYGRNSKAAKMIIDLNLDHRIINNAINSIDAKGIKAKLMKYALKHRRYYLMKLYSKVM